MQWKHLLILLRQCERLLRVYSSREKTAWCPRRWQTKGDSAAEWLHSSLSYNEKEQLLGNLTPIYSAGFNTASLNFKIAFSKRNFPMSRSHCVNTVNFVLEVVNKNSVYRELIKRSEKCVDVGRFHVGEKNSKLEFFNRYWIGLYFFKFQ